MMAGNAMPSADRHRAPNREMNSSRLGMATANRTANSASGKIRFFQYHGRRLFEISGVPVQILLALRAPCIFFIFTLNFKSFAHNYF